MNTTTPASPLNFAKRHVANLNAHHTAGNSYRASWPTIATRIG